MTVLRSREVVTKINSKSASKSMENEVLEPSTPAKTLEFLNQQSNSSTPSTSPSGGSLFPKELKSESGSKSVSVTGPVRRRSLRLAAKSGTGFNGNVENVDISSKKRKSFDSEEKENCVNGFDSGNLKSESVGDVENSILHLGMKKVRVSEEVGTDINNVGDTAEVPIEAVKIGSFDVRLYDALVSSRHGEQTVEGKRMVNGKRKLGIEVGLLRSEMNDNEKKFLSLRSGKRVSRREVEDKTVSHGAEFAGVESSNGDKEVQGAESKIMLNDKNFKCVEVNESKTNVNGTGNLKGRSKLPREEKAKGKLVEQASSIMARTSDMISIADEVQGTPHLAETVDVKAVDNDLGSVWSETGVMTRGRLSRADKGNDENFECVEVNESKTNVNGTGNLKGRSKLTREEKGKGKLVEKASSTMAKTSEMISIAGKILETPHLAETVDVKAVDKDLGSVGSETCVITRGRLSRADKGKVKLADDDYLTSVSNAAYSAETLALQERKQIAETNVNMNTEKRGHKERFRDVAKRNASRFAHFSSQEEENHAADVALGDSSPSERDGVTEDWPGPFSTAMKIIKDRGMNLKMQHQNASLGKSKDLSVEWVPKKDQQLNRQKRFVPSLQELCWPVLVQNAAAITSLDCIPDVIKHKLSQLLCDSRRMNSHFLELLVCGSPTEIRVWECSWLTEEIFTRIFEGCDTRNLMVLQLDQCGCCLPDYILSGTLARLPNSLPALTTISLKGAYRLSDVGLSTLVSSATSLRSINLSQCSLLTSDGISCLADSLGSILRELYLDDCQGVNASLILPALLKLQYLEVLSLAGIQTVCDNFVNKFVTARGHNLKELILKDCVKLTDASVKVIAETCSGLCAIDLSNLSKLTDAAIGYLANGCHAIHKLNLCRNLFSDEAIAAYLETCGDSLKELSLNHVSKVAHNTAVSLAKCSNNLLTLDLSWCRNLSNEALGLIVDSCLSLKVLKLFGCTQITNVFVNGHSNPQVRMIGLKMTPMLQHFKEPDFLTGPLRYSSAV